MTPKQMGRKGGKAKSAAKTAAARKNWKKARAAIEAKRRLSQQP